MAAMTLQIDDLLLQVEEIEARVAYTAAKLRTWNWHYEHIILKASSSWFSLMKLRSSGIK